MNKAQLTEMLAAASKAVIAFAKADKKLREANRDAAILCVRLATEGKQDVEGVIAKAKADYGYDKADKAAQQTFRTWAKYVRRIANDWGKLNEEQRKAFLSGEAPASAVFSALTTKPKAEDTAPDTGKAEETAPDAAHILTRGEMIVHAATLMEAFANGESYSDTEAAAIGMLLDAVDAFRAAETVRLEKAA